MVDIFANLIAYLAPLKSANIFANIHNSIIGHIFNIVLLYNIPFDSTIFSKFQNLNFFQL